MSLHENIAALKSQFVKQLPQKTLETMARATEELAASGILEKTIKLGDTLPAFTLTNQDGEATSSADLLKDGPLVISVYRGQWCPYCNLELEALERSAAQFRAAGANVVIISPQTTEKSKVTKSERSLSFDVLSDLGNSYSRELGLVFGLSEELQALYKGLGIDLPAFNGDESWELPMPARLVIDGTGKVVYADINPDYTLRPEPEDTLAALKAL
ncbi:hypothetical protein RUESEDTHA_04111 [Ruegeria sp. THAF57]|uniref:peroxiredoxin-like family protein n=1 Tax=Ruegeria sp. THAF57 TaxID=2744555 RepID=UPI0015DDC97A|nr:peroxiredoxin-like family protein [Ruegeria sp. THAF57]CAD0187199.1 hypothetical protein RUESEDTHA_04111 [Ruegeria sp. THAF57]